MKFVNGLILTLKETVGPQVDSRMRFDAIVSIAERLQITNKLTAPQKPPYEQKQFKQWSQGTRMEFTNSDSKLLPNVAPAHQRQTSHPGAKNAVNLGYFPHSKKDITMKNIVV